MTTKYLYPVVEGQVGGQDCASGGSLLSCRRSKGGPMAKDAECVLADVRELVRREIHPARQRLGALGIGNVLREGRLRPEEWMEAWVLMDRLLGANTMLIELLGIDQYIGGREKRRSRGPRPVVVARGG